MKSKANNPLPPVVEDNDQKPVKKGRGVHVKSPGDCVRLLNRLTNVCLYTKDKFELDRLKAVTYSVNTMAKIFETIQANGGNDINISFTEVKEVVVAEDMP